MELSVRVLIVGAGIAGWLMIIGSVVVALNRPKPAPRVTGIVLDTSVWLECVKCRTRWIAPSRLDAYQDGWQQQASGTWLCDACRED